MPAGNTGDTGEHSSWWGHPVPCPSAASPGTRGPGTVPPTSCPPHTPCPREGGARGGRAVPHPSGSCWASSRRSVPGEAAATCKERQRCQAVGTQKRHPLAQLGVRGAFLACPVPSCLPPVGCNRAWGQGASAGPCCAPSYSPHPGQGDTHADLSTSCRIFFTESLMPKAMLLRMFLK